MRGGGYLGVGDAIIRDVGKLEAHVLAIRNDPLKTFESVVRQSTIRPGEVAQVDITLPDAGDQRLFRFEVRDIRGNPYATSGQLFWTKQGQLSIRWASALSDPPGNYALSITDVITGQSANIGVTIAGPAHVESIGQ